MWSSQHVEPLSEPSTPGILGHVICDGGGAVARAAPSVLAVNTELNVLVFAHIVQDHVNT
jgi:hypothetical protein